MSEFGVDICYFLSSSSTRNSRISLEDNLRVEELDLHGDD